MDNERVQMYDTKDMMDILKIKRTTLQKLLLSGEFPATKIGGNWRVSKRALEKWIVESEGKEIFI